MHALHEYICKQLDERLRKHAIVVLYDPRREFEPLFDRELLETGKGFGEVPRIHVGERLTFLIRHKESLFAVRTAAEPILDLDKPEPLIIYLPGVERDQSTSILMELEKGGVTYEPQLKRLALNVLRKQFTDGKIDEMLKSPSVGYDDIVSFLQQGESGGTASVLRTIMEKTQSESLLIRWLADDNQDRAIAEKGATDELLKLVESRLGLPFASDTPLPEARAKALRYMLINEFRSDLECDPPASISMTPTMPTKEHLERARDIVEGLRRGYPESYVSLAQQVEDELGLAQARIEAQHLGSIDTFRFEERALLAYAGELICERKYSQALGIIAGRQRSFWIDRDIGRQAQWEACRWMAELGHEIERVRPSLEKANRDSASWVKAYATEGGWYRVDTLQRRLETWVATMEAEPETERSLAIVRREHEELLQAMAEGYAKALETGGWAVTGAFPQTRIYSDVVQSTAGRVAYFLIDAMRFEMGVELVRQLEGSEDLTIRPALASLPTITPVGMAALLPGAAASFSVVEHKGSLAAQIEDTPLTGIQDRLKFFKAKFPGVVDVPLGKLLTSSSSKLKRSIGDTSLILVRSQEIDALGENVDEYTARAAMEPVISNVARAMRKLAAAGIENFVVTADHGHQFSIRKEEDMKTDNPGGKAVSLHRRCWMGHGGTTPTGTVRVSGAELGYETDADFVFPTGLGVFKAGGGLCFHHGGISLQEMVIPVITCRFPSAQAGAAIHASLKLENVPPAVTNRTFIVRLVSETLAAMEEIHCRVVLIADGQQVGSAVMVHGAIFDRESGIIEIKASGSVVELSAGIMVTDDQCEKVRVVVQDARTDAVLAQSEVIPVKLGI